MSPKGDTWRVECRGVACGCARFYEAQKSANEGEEAKAREEEALVEEAIAAYRAKLGVVVL